jgi:serine/threonine protein kinase
VSLSRCAPSAEQMKELPKVKFVDQEAAVASSSPKWTRQAGSQPIPGYRLLEPLGRGGFGEVWKCEAPGGLYKAIKFVSNQDEQSGPASQERKALQLVKAIRHPFILSLERVETVEDALVIVMELADKSLFSLLGDYQASGQRGIPHEELLGYLLEAAEALDWMNFGHGLQHLDVKPHNLFLISNHVKVADFGLVDQLTDIEKTHPRKHDGGITPLYAAPELLNGTVSRRCDQYSLAIVYQQLLTGTVPFWCQNMYQLIMYHLSGEPNLDPLPKEDRAIVARALSKRPEDRFPSCLDFLQALVCGPSAEKPAPPRRSALVKKIVSARASHPHTPSAAVPEDAKEPERPLDALRWAPPGGSPTVPTGGDSEAKPPPPPNSNATVARTGLCERASLSQPRATGGMETPASGSAPTCITLPGYRFLRCISQTPLGDTWQVEDEQGRLRRAFCLPSFADRDPTLIERLQNVKHPSLAAAEVFWSPSGRWVLLGEAFEQTLRDRLESCLKQGLPGIPRAELLGYLRTAAEVIDAVYQKYSLPHLGLNPRTLMLREEKLWMVDYGLVPLLWLPTGQTGGSLNGRYAAPELFEKVELTGIPPGEAARAALMGRAGSTADQFSLALIYAEMLNGIPPQLPRAPSTRRAGSGSNGRPGPMDSQQVLVCGQLRLDFDLLPACDREILRKALNDDPQQRFPTCTELVDALEAAASRTARRADLYHRLPSVIPFASLQGEPSPKDITLPSLHQLVCSLAIPAHLSPSPPRTIQGGQHTRCVLLGNDVWESKCPVQIFSGALELKVEGFRSEWQARLVEHKGNSFLLHIEPPPARPEDRDKNNVPLIAFELDVQTTQGSVKHFAEARMRVHPAGGNRYYISRLLPSLAPRLFESMRCYLQAGPEQRAEDRWHCPQPLHVYPVRPDLELEQVLDGISRNISRGGVSFRVAEAPRAELAYLHWHKSPILAPYAVRVRIIRVQPMAGGGFEVGGVF